MKWIGLDRYREQLLNLPAHLTAQAAPIVRAAAERALLAAQQHYPEQSKTIQGTGNLRRGLRIDVLAAGRNGVNIRLRNTAPHAYLYEIGTRGKLRKTGRGYNRGAMPPGHVFIPAAMRARAVMYEQLERMLEAEGLDVRRAA